jgi:hypothetical protein
MRRFAVGTSVVTTLLVAATLALGAMTGAAYAVTHATCKKASGTVSGNITIGSCSPINAQYKTASAKATSLQSGGTLVWAPSKKTTVFKGTATSKGQGGCAVGSTEYDFSGTVTGGTATYTKKGDIVKGRACLTGVNISLVPHTSFTL